MGLIDRVLAGLAALSLAFFSSVAAEADGIDASPSESAAPETWAIHGQTTVVEQYHPAFRSLFQGANSLDPGSRGDETFDATLYFGVRPWDGAEIWADGEIDQGFGLSNTEGVAGFPNGEGAKIGKTTPYPKLPRLFLRQTIDLGGEMENVDPDINQLGGTQDKNRIVLTVGKFAVPDIFDHNAFADDSKHDFLNWALVDLATFDYAANAWGYTYGAAAEWYQDWWTLRAGIFDLSTIPNTARLEEVFLRQFQVVGEFEERHTLWGQPGAVRLLSFLTHGRMGLFSDAIALSQSTDEPANIALVRHMHERSGVGINFDQHLTDDIGIFGRAGYDDPSREPFEFIDVDAATSAGVAVQGTRWARPDDVFAVAFILNSITREHAEYFNRGGLGILVGDGKLPHPGDEKIVEVQYSFAATNWLKISPDYQYIDNPAYNRDRGPVSILGARIHAEF
jgi:high affinity Mn2+ porin